MPTRSADGIVTPSWDDCKTEEQLDSEYNNWASTVAREQFARDKGISTDAPNFDSLYSQARTTDSKKFYKVGDNYYYYGEDTSVRDQFKKQKGTLSSKKNSMFVGGIVDGVSGGVKDTVGLVTETVRGEYVFDKDTRNELLTIGEDYKAGKITDAEKQARIESFNETHGTNIDPTSDYSKIRGSATKTTGGITNALSDTWVDVRNSMDGSYVMSEAARKDLTNIAARIDSGELSGDDRAAAIKEFNKTYGTNLSEDASSKSLQSAANKKNGILHITGNDIAAGVKDTMSDLGNLSPYWDHSTDKNIQKFTSKGITGDVMWGVIWGKYNKDDAARRDLEKLADLVSAGKGNSEEAKALRDKINTKYGLELDESVTAEDIAKVIESDQKYTYNQTVRKIAEGIVQDNMNKQIKKRMEDFLGGKLEDWGFNFQNGDIIGTLRDIIRGNQVAFFNEKRFVERTVTELTGKIDKMIDEQARQINAQIDKVAKGAIDAIDPYRKQVDSMYSKLDSWMSNPASAKLQIANRLDTLIKSPVDSIAGKIDKLDPFRKIGLSMGLGNMFKSVTQTFTKGLADKLYKITKPIVETALKIVGTVKTAIKKVIDTINKLKEKAKQLIEKWKNIIKDTVKKITTKIVNELLRYVKVSFGSLFGGNAAGALSDAAGSAVGGAMDSAIKI